MKAVYQVLKLYETEPRIRICNYLLQILDDEKNDRGLSVFISHFYKQFCQECSPDDFPKYLEHTKSELFNLCLDPLKDESLYILDLTERIQAALNLYTYLVTREKALLKQGQLTNAVLTDSKYQDEVVRKRYFENLTHTIEAGL